MGMITTNLHPQTKKDVIGLAELNPDDNTIMLWCIENRDWEITKDFTGITAEVYKQTMVTEDVFKNTVIERFKNIPVATFASGICQSCFSLYGLDPSFVIQIPSAFFVARSGFTPWESLEENTNVLDWIRYLNRNKAHVKRQDMLEAAETKRSDKRGYGVKCLDNLETDGLVWQAVLDTLC